MKNPKVLVAAPTWNGHKYIIKEYLRKIKRLSYPNYDVLLADNSKGDSFLKFLLKTGIKVIKIPWDENPFVRICNSRNFIINYFLQHDYEYLLSVDTDTIIPKNTIEKLLKHKKDLVGFLCHMGTKIKVPSVFKSGHIVFKGRKGLNFYSWKELKAIKKDLIPVYAVSVSCLLIHRKVFEANVRFRFTPYLLIGEDLWFFAECNEKGFQFWLDKSIRVKHYNKDRRMLRWKAKQMHLKAIKESKMFGK